MGRASAEREGVSGLDGQPRLHCRLRAENDRLDAFRLRAWTSAKLPRTKFEKPVCLLRSLAADRGYRRSEPSICGPTADLRKVSQGWIADVSRVARYTSSAFRGRLRFKQRQ